MEIYVSTDIETNGPCPGLYSMLSLGSAAFDEQGRLHCPVCGSDQFQVREGEDFLSIACFSAKHPCAWVKYL